MDNLMNVLSGLGLFRSKAEVLPVCQSEYENFMCQTAVFIFLFLASMIYQIYKREDYTTYDDQPVDVEVRRYATTSGGGDYLDYFIDQNSPWSQEEFNFRQ